MTAVAVCPERYGSSPNASKLRPFIGTRAMLTSGASMTSTPLCQLSQPIASPRRRCRAGSQLDACAIGAGNAVVFVWPPPLPGRRRSGTRSGMQRAGLAGTRPATP